VSSHNMLNIVNISIHYKMDFVGPILLDRTYFGYFCWTEHILAIFLFMGRVDNS